MCALVAWLCFAAPSLAAVSAVITGPDLVPREVTVQSAGNGGVSYFGDDRNLRTQPLDELLQIELRHESSDEPGPAAQNQPTGVLLLNDGQRIAGAFAGADEKGQRINWQHPALGRVSVPLDKVTSLTLGEGGGRVQPGQTTDRVVLANGDELTGFVEAVRSDGVDLRIQGQDRATTLPLDRVRGVHLANPVNASQARGHLAVLRDGSTVRVESFVIQGDTALLRPTLLEGVAGRKTPVAQLQRIDIHSDAGRLVRLIEQPMSVPSGGEVFGVEMPPRVQDGALWLHAPVKVRYELPEGAQRFAATAELAVRRGQAVAWADVTLRVIIDGKTVQQLSLNGRQLSAAINVPARGAVLEIELDEAGNGPVLDRVWLRRAVVAVSGG